MERSGLEEKTERESKPGIVICQLHMPLPLGYPTYHRELALTYPDLQFELLSCMETESDEMMEDIRVSGRQINPGLVEFLRSEKGVRTVATLEQASRFIMLRLTIDTTPLAKIFKELHLMMRYPVPFGGGAVHLLIVAPEGRVRTAYARIKEKAPSTIVVSIHHDVVVGKAKLLTPKQTEVFKLAMSAGFWDVPRRVTLADLAGLTHVSKSTIWETLAMIESKLLHEVREDYLAELTLANDSRN